MNENQILKKILILNLDEKGKTFNTGFTIKSISVESKINDIIFNDYDIVIVCTQNSLSGNSKHFQSKFKHIIKNHGFEMLSKIDATRQENRRSFGILKGSNVRTRIYINNNVKIHFNKNKFQYSYPEKNGSEQYNNKRSEKINDITIVPNMINISGLSIFRKTDKNNKKEGVIYVALKFEYSGISSNNKFYLIVKNISKNFQNEINYETNLLQSIKKTSGKNSKKFIIDCSSKKSNIVTLKNLNSNERVSNKKVAPFNNENHESTRLLEQEGNIINKKNINSQFKSSLVKLQEIVGKIYGGQNATLYNKFTLEHINNLNVKSISEEEKKLIDLLLITICIYVIIDKFYYSLNKSQKQSFLIQNFPYVKDSFNEMKTEILNFKFNNKKKNNNNIIENDFLTTLKHLVQLKQAKGEDLIYIIENLYTYNYGWYSPNKRKDKLKKILKEYQEYLTKCKFKTGEPIKKIINLKKNFTNKLVKDLNEMYELYKNQFTS